METLKKQTNIRGDVNTDKYFVETLKKDRQIFKQTNIVETLKERGDVKENRNRQIFVEKQTNIRGDVKGTDKYSWRG